MTAPSMPPSTPDRPFPAPWETGPTVFPAAAPSWPVTFAAVFANANPADLITVSTSACCEAMPGDDCGCASWAGEVYASFGRPITWRPPPAHLSLPSLPLTAGVVGLNRDGAR